MLQIRSRAQPVNARFAQEVSSMARLAICLLVVGSMGLSLGTLAEEKGYIPNSSTSERFLIQQVKSLPSWYQETFRKIGKWDRFHGHSVNRDIVVNVRHREVKDEYEFETYLIWYRNNHGASKKERLIMSTTKPVEPEDDQVLDIWLATTRPTGSISTDGRYLLFFGLNAISEMGSAPGAYLFLYDFQTAKRIRVANLTFNPRALANIAWSHDGTKFVFSDLATIYVYSVPEGTATQITKSPEKFEGKNEEAAFDFAWSPDDREIIYKYLRDIQQEYIAADVPASRQMAEKPALFKIRILPE